MSWLGFDPDPPIILLHDPFADGKSNAGPGIFVICVQAFEEAKDVLLVFGRDADAVIAYGESPLSDLAISSDAHDWLLLPVPILDRIPYKVLEQLLEVYRMHMHRG